MPRSLPAHPSLEHLRNEARAVLKAHRAGDAGACVVLRQLPRFAALSDQAVLAADVQLHDVQHALARSYGSANWAAIKARVLSSQHDARVRRQYTDSSRVAARYALHARFSTGKRPFALRTFDEYRDIPPVADILELGCGPGGLWLANRDRIPPGWRILITDASEGMIREARANLKVLQRPLEFSTLDISRINLADAQYDAVLANHVLPHSTDLDATAGAIARILKPGGRLYASTNGRGHMLELRQFVLDMARHSPRMKTLAREFGQNAFASRFGLDNAPAVLRPHFRHVEVRPFDNALVVDQPRPVIDYVLSCLGGEELTGPDVADLQRRLGALVSPGTPLRIRVEAGMVVAWK